MSLEVFSLASGSSGNAMLVRGQHHDLLLDCGMTRSFLEDAFRRSDTVMERLCGIVLTHEHIDHSRGVLAMARRYRVPVVGSRGTLDVALQDSDVVHQVLTPRVPSQFGEFTVTGYPVSHDAREPMAIAVGTDRHRICYAVDLGLPDETLMDACRDAALVVLEANHDVNRLIHGPYASHLKERILGQNGHLSNQDAAKVIAEVSGGDRPIHFWLAHLSAVNNTPRAALRSASLGLRSVGKSQCGVEVAARDRPSLRWSADNHWWQPQLSLGF